MRKLLWFSSLLIWTILPAQAVLNAVTTYFPPASGQFFNDSFDRPDTTDLGPNWRETLPDFERAGQAVRNATGDGHPRAAIFSQSIGPDQDVSVACKVTAPENACGVMARYSDENNFYRARIDVGRQNILLAKTVRGETTVLGRVPREMRFDTYYQIPSSSKEVRCVSSSGMRKSR